MPASCTSTPLPRRSSRGVVAVFTASRPPDRAHPRDRARPGGVRPAGTRRRRSALRGRVRRGGRRRERGGGGGRRRARRHRVLRRFHRSTTRARRTRSRSRGMRPRPPTPSQPPSVTVRASLTIPRVAVAPMEGRAILAVARARRPAHAVRVDPGTALEPRPARRGRSVSRPTVLRVVTPPRRRRLRRQGGRRCRPIRRRLRGRAASRPSRALRGATRSQPRDDAGPRAPLQIALHARRNGTIVGLEIEECCDAGAYPSTGSVEPGKTQPHGVRALPGPGGGVPGAQRTYQTAPVPAPTAGRAARRRPRRSSARSTCSRASSSSTPPRCGAATSSPRPSSPRPPPPARTTTTETSPRCSTQLLDRAEYAALAGRAGTRRAASAVRVARHRSRHGGRLDRVVRRGRRPRACPCSPTARVRVLAGTASAGQQHAPRLSQRSWPRCLPVVGRRRRGDRGRHRHRRRQRGHVGLALAAARGQRGARRGRRRARAGPAAAPPTSSKRPSTTSWSTTDRFIVRGVPARGITLAELGTLPRTPTTTRRSTPAACSTRTTRPTRVARTSRSSRSTLDTGRSRRCATSRSPIAAGSSTRRRPRARSSARACRASGRPCSRSSRTTTPATRSTTSLAEYLVPARPRAPADRRPLRDATEASAQPTRRTRRRRNRYGRRARRPSTARCSTRSRTSACDTSTCPAPPNACGVPIRACTRWISQPPTEGDPRWPSTYPATWSGPTARCRCASSCSTTGPSSGRGPNLRQVARGHRSSGAATSCRPTRSSRPASSWSSTRTRPTATSSRSRRTRRSRARWRCTSTTSSTASSAARTRRSRCRTCRTSRARRCGWSRTARAASSRSRSGRRSSRSRGASRPTRSCTCASPVWDWVHDDMKAMCDNVNLVLDREHGERFEKQIGRRGVYFTLDQVRRYVEPAVGIRGLGLPLAEPVDGPGAARRPDARPRHRPFALGPLTRTLRPQRRHPWTPDDAKTRRRSGCVIVTRRAVGPGRRRGRAGLGRGRAGRGHVGARRRRRRAAVEKADLIGGTTGVSGGMPWVPMNHHMADVGVTRLP